MRRLPSLRGMCLGRGGVRLGIGLVRFRWTRDHFRTHVRSMLWSVEWGREGKGRPARPRLSMCLRPAKSGYHVVAAAILSGSVQPRKACPPAVHSPGVGPSPVTSRAVPNPLSPPEGWGPPLSLPAEFDGPLTGVEGYSCRCCGFLSFLSFVAADLFGCSFGDEVSDTVLRIRTRLGEMPLAAARGA